ncbi:hypothetical protein BDV28DRAFT_35299 [Aspergillus coremiiformis]|uniref:Uncharacterized protein n=1 Tax=Aspergillus coremiiformis TaxID=138285 RepID=A0A5N6YYX8_9EURO|nr:hypothetical protein BDV28DRAFT_35299 [Aspergillus coremiiformis]
MYQIPPLLRMLGEKDEVPRMVFEKVALKQTVKQAFLYSVMCEYLGYPYKLRAFSPLHNNPNPLSIGSTILRGSNWKSSSYTEQISVKPNPLNHIGVVSTLIQSLI